MVGACKISFLEPFPPTLDTAGPEEYSRLRPLSYGLTDVFLVCFSVVSPSSFENVRSKWLPEIRLHSANYPNYRTVLVGTKTDLRHDEYLLQKMAAKLDYPVDPKDAIALAKEEGMDAYVETSARQLKGIKGCFDTALSVVLDASGFDYEEHQIAKQKAQCQLM